MAGYGNYGSRQYGGGGYNRGSYNNSGGNGYGQQSQPETPPPTPEEYLNKKLDMYILFKDIISQRGLDPTDFAFGLTQWVTGYDMTLKDYEKKKGK